MTAVTAYEVVARLLFSYAALLLVATVVALWVDVALGVDTHHTPAHGDGTPLEELLT